MKHQSRYLTAVIFLCLALCTASAVIAAGWVTSGDTAIATTSDTAVTVTQITPGLYQKIVFVNKGSVDGQLTVDGVHFAPLFANGSVNLDGPIRVVNTGDVQVRRFAGGSNLSGVWVFAY